MGLNRQNRIAKEAVGFQKLAERRVPRLTEFQIIKEFITRSINE
jgi:hypothetical protein